MNYKANVLKYDGNIRGIYLILGPSAVEHAPIMGQIEILKNFDRIILNYDDDADERDAIYQVISEVKMVDSTIKFYGFTERLEGEIFAAWLAKADAWEAAYGNILDGLYVADFDANDIWPEDYSNVTYPIGGEFTRAEQNLAILACHNHGYELFAESGYPELTLGPATIGETASLMGINQDYQDGILVKNWFSDRINTPQRAKRTRLGTLAYLKGYKDSLAGNLFTVISYDSGSEYTDPEGLTDHVPIDHWDVLHREKEQYGIDGFAVLTEEGNPSARWFYTNKLREIYRYDPRKSVVVDGITTNILFDFFNEVSYDYSVLYGNVLPTVQGETVSPITVKYRRSTDLVDGVPYFDKSGEIEVTPYDNGYWEVLLGAALTPGSSYSITVSEEGCRGVKKTKTLIGGTSVEF
jgi:hypothetical protein